MKQIFSKFFLKTAAVSFCLISSAFFVTQYNHYRDLRRHYLNTAQRISQSLSSQFSLYYHNIQNISFNDSLQDLNKGEVTEYFDSLIALYPDYDILLLTDLAGNYVASNTIGSEGESLKLQKIKNQNFSQSSWHRQISSNELSEEFERGLWGAGAQDFESSPLISELYGREKVGMHLSAPVRDSNGKLVGHVTSFINKNWLRKELQTLSSQFFGGEERDFDAFLVNKRNKTLASNQNEEFPSLSDLPFVVETANFSKHFKEGNFLEGINSFLKFAKHPFYIISKFNHQNFLSDLGWSLIIKMNKERALGSIINSLAWFWGAFLLFLLTSVGLIFKAFGKIEKFEKSATSSEKTVFEDALDKARLQEIFISLSESVEKAKQLLSRPQIELSKPGMESAESEEEPGHLALSIGACDHSLKKIEQDHAGFNFLVKKRLQSGKEAKGARRSLEWNLEKAQEVLQELKVSVLNIEIGRNRDHCPAGQTRNLDALVDRTQKHLKESASIGAYLEKEAEARAQALEADWRSYDQRLGKSFSAAKESFESAQEASEAFLEAYEKNKAQELDWSEQSGVIRAERETLENQKSELLKEMESMRHLLILAQTILEAEGLPQEQNPVKKAS